jgi:hypothetical protein
MSGEADEDTLRMLRQIDSKLDAKERARSS